MTDEQEEQHNYTVTTTMTIKKSIQIIIINPDNPVNKQTRHDLERLLEESNDAFAEDERQIGTTPLIKMSTDTSDHPPIAKKPYALALKHYDWVRDVTDKLLKAGVIQESHSSWSALIVVVPIGDGGKRLWMDFRALNAITRTYVCPCPGSKTSLLNWVKQNSSPCSI